MNVCQKTPAHRAPEGINNLPRPLRLAHHRTFPIHQPPPTRFPVFIRKLAEIQAALWQDTRDNWADLWMLRVEGEMNMWHREMVVVWKSRWADVDDVTCALNINQVKKLYQELPLVYHESQQAQAIPGRKSAPVIKMLAPLKPFHGGASPHIASGYAISNMVAHSAKTEKWRV